MENWSQDNQKDHQTQKMRFSKKAMIAMFSPGEYGKLLHQPVKELIKYLLCFVLLLTLIGDVIPMAGAIAGMGGIGNIITERIPQFEWKDGNFTLDDVIEIKDEQTGVYILVDTGEQAYSKDDIMDDPDLMEEILVSRTNMIVCNKVAGMPTLLQEYKFSDFGSLNITNESLVKWIPFYYVMIVVGMIGSYIFTGLKYLCSALFFAGVIYFLLRLMLQQDLQFGYVYKIAIYAKTIGTLVATITLCIGGPVLIMAGDAFGIFVTLTIMNRVCLGRVIQV